VVGPRAARVLMVGSVNVDYVVRARRLPSAGETVVGGVFDRHQGGKGANQAVAAARLGGQVTFIGAVGRDEAGRDALDELRREGVGVTGCVVLDGVATGVALIVVDDAGENQIAVASGANAMLTALHVEAALAGSERRGGAFLASFEVPDEAVLAGADWAARAGMRIVINPAPARPLRTALLALQPLLVLNEGEAQALTGTGGTEDAEDAARSLASRTRAPVVITLGASGALVVEGAELLRLPAPRLAAVDSTGAGDAFAGALAAELARGASLVEGVHFAVGAAALSVGAAGARAGMPRRDEMEKLRGWRAEWDSNPRHED
jgi:ribokinase